MGCLIRSTCPFFFSGRPDQTLKFPLWSSGCPQTPAAIRSDPDAKFRRIMILFSIRLADQMKTGSPFPTDFPIDESGTVSTVNRLLGADQWSDFPPRTKQKKKKYIYNLLFRLLCKHNLNIKQYYDRPVF